VLKEAGGRPAGAGVQRKGLRSVIAHKHHAIRVCDAWRHTSNRVSSWHEREREREREGGRERDVSYQIHRPAPLCPRVPADPVDSGLCGSESHSSCVGEQKCVCPLRDSHPDYLFTQLVNVSLYWLKDRTSLFWSVLWVLSGNLRFFFKICTL
jgi:hypothetical protein